MVVPEVAKRSWVQIESGFVPPTWLQSVLHLKTASESRARIEPAPAGEANHPRPGVTGT